jgi:hypothetical protein
MGSTILRKHLDDVPLWRGDSVPVRQLVDDFARYLYLPRLGGSEVLLHAIKEGVALLTWETDTFAYAESYDEASQRYRGLRAGRIVSVSADDNGLLVKPEIARRQMYTEAPPPVPPPQPGEDNHPKPPTPTPPGERTFRRFHGTVSVDPSRVGRDAGRIAEEVIANLAGQVNADVTVTIEIEALLPNGASDQIIRTVTENCSSLRFTSHGFEAE